LFENLNDAYIISMPMFATCKLSCVHEKSWIGILKERNVFWRWVTKFCGNFSRRWKLQFLLLSDAYNYNIDAYFCKCVRLASEKFVLASESNLSLATGLASWKVSLEPCRFVLRSKTFPTKDSLTQKHSNVQDNNDVTKPNLSSIPPLKCTVILEMFLWSHRLSLYS